MKALKILIETNRIRKAINCILNRLNDKINPLRFNFSLSRKSLSQCYSPNFICLYSVYMKMVMRLMNE